MTNQKPQAVTTAEGHPQAKAEGQTPTDPEVDAVKKKKSDSDEEPEVDMKGVINLCKLAGVPEMAGDFLLAGMTTAQVSKKLLAMRAEGEGTEGAEINSHVAPHAGTSAAGYFNPDTNPLMAACKRIAGIK